MADRTLERKPNPAQRFWRGRVHLARDIVLSLLFATSVESADLSITAAARHLGACDGSAGVPVGKDQFITASDEDNILRLYSVNADSVPTKLDLPLNQLLNAPRKKQHADEFRECDLEAVTQIEHRFYWIGSHGRDKDGKMCPEREVLFATDLEYSENKIKLSFVGKGPYRKLIDDIINAPNLTQIHDTILEARNPKGTDQNKAPTKHGALNIEALCSNGNALLIGFRNPIPGGKALLLPFMNPDAVVEKGEHASFGQPIFLDLGGLGFRDMVRWKDKFLIVAGDYRDGSDPDSQKSKLFEWDGPGKAPTSIELPLGDLNPEGAVVFGDKVLLLSDDGTLEVDGSKMKDLEESKRFFRSVWLERASK